MIFMPLGKWLSQNKRIFYEKKAVKEIDLLGIRIICVP